MSNGFVATHPRKSHIEKEYVRRGRDGCGQLVDTVSRHPFERAVLTIAPKHFFAIRKCFLYSNATGSGARRASRYSTRVHTQPRQQICSSKSGCTRRSPRRRSASGRGSEQRRRSPNRRSTMTGRLSIPAKEWRISSCRRCSPRATMNTSRAIASSPVTVTFRIRETAEFRPSGRPIIAGTGRPSRLRERVPSRYWPECDARRVAAHQGHTAS